MGTAGLARSLVNGQRRVPRPPPRIKQSTFMFRDPRAWSTRARVRRRNLDSLTQGICSGCRGSPSGSLRTRPHHEFSQIRSPPRRIVEGSTGVAARRCYKRSHRGTRTGPLPFRNVGESLGIFSRALEWSRSRTNTDGGPRPPRSSDSFTGHHGRSEGWRREAAMRPNWPLGFRRLAAAQERRPDTRKRQHRKKQHVGSFDASVASITANEAGAARWWLARGCARARPGTSRSDGTDDLNGP